jgi:hypothetical protein
VSEETGAYLVAPTEPEASKSSTAGEARALIAWETVAVVEMVGEWGRGHR